MKGKFCLPVSILFLDICANNRQKPLAIQVQLSFTDPGYLPHLPKASGQLSHHFLESAVMEDHIGRDILLSSKLKAQGAQFFPKLL